MEYHIEKNDIIIKSRDFELNQTLDCGQAFRWVKVDENSYKGFYLNKSLFITQSKISENEDVMQITLHDTSKSDFLGIWRDYFDLNTDYTKLKKEFSKDKTLSEACDYAPGIRLLKQDSWEALCSFIISQNNNIPRIKGIISRLCEHYGGFPTYYDLAKETPESLSFLRSGFRAKYLIDAATKLSSGEISFERIKKASLDEARAELMKIVGVGPKVAECALLYGMYRTDAFPIDVWIKRVMAEYYPDGLPDCIKGYEGIAQQFLFHYIRTYKEK